MTTALITGGSRGIGRAICVALAARGHNVAINYAGNAAEAERTAILSLEAAREAGFPDVQALTHKADVSSSAETDALFEAVEANLGAPDILVNNAGITRDNLLVRMPEEDFDAVIATNLKGAFNCTKRASRALIKQRTGRIVNIASVVGITGNAGQANYAASKAGLIGFTKSVARELAGRNITVNAVAPGFITTAMTEVLDEKTRLALLESIPQKRLGTPEDIAHVVEFLCSEAAAYITGQVIAVDGGMTI
jgi:3-oxoacyl-[acyl-carrier protein] reductase